MSLINKVLTDLEARSGTPGYAQPARPFFEDLRPVRPVSSRPSRRMPLLILLAFTLGAVALYGGMRWQKRQEDVTARHVALPVTARPVEQALLQPPTPLAASTPMEASVTPLPTPVAVAELPASAEVDSAPVKARPAAMPKKKEKSTPVVAAIPGETAGIDKKARPLTTHEQAENAYRAAGTAVKRQDRAQAERELKNALALNAKHAPARELYAGLLLEQGRALEAQQLLEQGLAKMPDHYPFAQLLARLYVEHGAEHKALAVLQQARASGQGNADFLALSATLAQRAGRHTDAIADFGAALRLRPAEGRWWAGLGISLETDRRWSEARDAYENARASGRLNTTLARHVDQRLAALEDRRDQR